MIASLFLQFPLAEWNGDTRFGLSNKKTLVAARRVKVGPTSNRHTSLN